MGFLDKLNQVTGGVATSKAGRVAGWMQGNPLPQWLRPKGPDTPGPGAPLLSFWDANYQGIIDTLNKINAQPTLMSLIPGIKETLGQREGYQTEAINAQTAQNVAQAQSDAMKRGLTGSDIEAQGMGQQRVGGAQALAAMKAESAGVLSNLLMQAQAGDNAAKAQLQTLIAQAMGEELTASRDFTMWQKNLEEQMAESARANKYALLSAIMSTGGRGVEAYFSKGASEGSRRTNKQGT